MSKTLNALSRSVVIVAAIAVSWPAIAADESAVSPQLEWAMRDLPEHTAPLFAIGDIDEDGHVDAEDLVLLRSLATARRDTWEDLPGVSCAGAGDLDLDTDIDSDDVALAERLLAGGARITAPSLFSRSTLPCRFQRLILAAELAANPGDEIPLYVLRPGYDQTNSRVSVKAGSASVAKADDPRAFVLEISPETKRDEVIELTIVFGEERYRLNVQVVAGPAAR